MKKTLFFLIILLSNLSVFSQDTIVIYLNDKFNASEKDSAKYIREAIVNNGHIYLTDKKLSGTIVNYCELSSLNPRIEDGKAIHYDKEDNLYSSGYYKNGALTGKWVYYNKDNSVDTVDYSSADFKSDRDNIKGAFNYLEYKNTKGLGYKILDSLSIFIKENFHIPARIIDGNITSFSVGISCTIDTDGKVRNPKLNNLTHRDLNNEIYRILGLFHYQGEIKEPFSISSLQCTYGKQPGNDKYPVFCVIEEMPSFRGGDAELLRFISENIRYPEEARKMNIQGKVVVRFVVTSEGTIKEVSVVNGVHPLIDAEAIRVVKMLPLFSPGRSNGKPVDVWYAIPINFRFR